MLCRHVRWVLKHVMINSNELEHMLAVLVKNITLVKGPWKMDGRLNRRWCTYLYFEKREDREWMLRNYTLLYEYCHFANCDRMQHVEDL